MFHPRLYRGGPDLVPFEVTCIVYEDAKMPRRFYFISHPNVVIDPQVPVPAWPLSDKGRARMHLGLQQPWVQDLSAIYCSTEQKAIDSAEILADAVDLPITQLPGLGENDRSSTGFLPPTEFELTADAFFAHPQQSVRGWETAAAAQTRIARCVSDIARSDRSSNAVAIVSHGAVGTLLHCFLAQNPISRHWDQPPNGGGNFYTFEMNPRRSLSSWHPIDALPE